MNRTAMYDKYHDAMVEMFEKTGDDNGVCLDKLIHTHLHKDTPELEVYPEIPEDFDWEAFAEDYAALTAE